MKKMFALTLCIIILFNVGCVFADEPKGAMMDKRTKKLMEEAKLEYTEQQIEEYLEGFYDLFGRQGEKLYFELRELYSGGKWYKEIEFDLKTTGLQFKMFNKNFNDSDIFYMGMLGLAGYSKIIAVSKASKAKKTAVKFKLITELFKTLK